MLRNEIYFNYDMNPDKERQLLTLMIRVCRGARVGADLELAEVAAREERKLQARLDELPPAPAAEQKAA